MTDLSNKTVEELLYYGYDYWRLLEAFDELASRLAKAQAEIERMRPVCGALGE